MWPVAKAEWSIQRILCTIFATSCEPKIISKWKVKIMAFQKESQDEFWRGCPDLKAGMYMIFETVLGIDTTWPSLLKTWQKDRSSTDFLTPKGEFIFRGITSSFVLLVCFFKPLWVCAKRCVLSHDQSFGKINVLCFV